MLQLRGRGFDSLAVKRTLLSYFDIVSITSLTPPLFSSLLLRSAVQRYGEVNHASTQWKPSGRSMGKKSSLHLRCGISHRFTRCRLLRLSFHLAVQTLDELKVLLPPRDLKDMRGLTQEVQLEINYLLLDRLYSLEQHDWAQFGKVRTALEKRLRGPEPKPRKKNK